MAPQPGFADPTAGVSTDARARLTAAASVSAVVLAAGAEAAGFSWRPFGADLTWVEWAAIACVVPALFAPGRWYAVSRWRTPLDARVMCAMLLAATQLLPVPATADPAFTLRQALACAGVYFGLIAQARAGGVAVERLWQGFALGAALLAAGVLSTIVGGLGALRAASAATDAAWGASAGLFKASLLLALLVTGRALEPDSGRHWRVLGLLAGISTVLLGAAAGTGMSSRALARLDDPLHFSGTVVLLLLVVEFVRRAWVLRRERPGQAFRWRGAGLASLTLAATAVFGGVTGGEGLRVLGVLLGVLLVLAAESPDESVIGEPGGEAGEPPVLQRAA